MSSGYKPDILWSPHHADRYVICDTELSLYRIGPAGSSETKAGALPLSEETAATLLAINSDTPYMKCVAWYPKQEPSVCWLWDRPTDESSWPVWDRATTPNVRSWWVKSLYPSTPDNATRSRGTRWTVTGLRLVWTNIGLIFLFSYGT